MVWAISILCVSLSCEPIPTIAGWFDTPEECTSALRLVDRAWKPTMGFYALGCVVRFAI